MKKSKTRELIRKLQYGGTINDEKSEDYGVKDYFG